MPMIMEGTRPNAADYGGHPAPTGPALPNLINAVRMLKSKSKSLKSIRTGYFYRKSGKNFPMARGLKPHNH